ncbi:MAG: alpha-galactosidase, partial [Clostridia bacterium]|nr:alpha-galactosidase [Clostridia bacterium]
LELTIRYAYYPRYGIVKWTNYWNNPTDHASGIITELCDCDITVPMRPDPPRTRRNRNLQKTMEPETMVLCTTQGANTTGDDHMIRPLRLWAGDHHEETCLHGRSGLGKAPFFDAVEGGERQNGILIAIGWTGQWRAQFDRGEDDLRIRHGIQDAAFRMLSGESFRTASTTVMLYTDGQTNAHNRWRRYIRDIISPFAPDKPKRIEQCPFSAIFWGGVPSHTLLERWTALLDAKLPFNYCWIDAGWYEPLTCMTTDEQMAEWGKIGSWTISRFYHPQAYRDVVSFLHERKIGFQLWFEPERMDRNIGTPLNYLCKRTPEETRVVTALNEDAVCDAVIEKISTIISDLSLDCYRQDFNIRPLEFWRQTDARQPNGEERRGTTEIHYINNLWRFWDTLLERHPGLLIDNCAGGGHRIDIEMLSRSVPLWRSDYQCTWDVCPEANQNQNLAAAWWYPYSGIGYGPTLGDTYSFRSAYTNGMTVRTWEHVDPEWDVGALGEPLDWARHYFDEYNRIRPYFSEDVYPLIPPTNENSTWLAAQYHRPADDSGIILAFRRAMCPYDRASVTLDGIDPLKTYCVTDADNGNTFSAIGEDLLRDGMTLTIPQKRQSLLLSYRAT